ncbi:hypothetical protein K438DRAFT_1835071 [Mycena galopus ATCC 62051]|nr:hypothetical protein K438DRAFT_1835071 [Mycena galopus ATCC 62051]
MDPADADATAVDTFFSQLTISQYASVCSACLYIYDFMLTFSDEVRYFWDTRMSLVKVLFFCNRYSVLFLVGFKFFVDIYAMPRATTCAGIESFEIIVSILCIAMTQVIMQIRIHAMYNQNKTLKIILSLLFIAETVAEFSIAIPEIRFVDVKPPFVVRALCSEAIPKYFFAFPIPSMGFEFILLVLAVHKACLHFWEAPKEMWVGSRLLSVIFRDSVLYFACGFGANLLNVLVWALGPWNLLSHGLAWGVTVPLLAAVPALAATHVLINMREIFHRPFDATVTASGTELRFAARTVGSNGQHTCSGSNSACRD